MAKKKAIKKASSPAPSTPAPSMDVDLALVEALLRLMKNSEATELDIDNHKAGLRVHLCRGTPAAAAAAPVVHVLQGGAMAAAPLPAGALAPVAAPAAAAAPAGPPPGTKEFNSPMVGTFYRSSSPDAEPFASVGKSVKPDTTLCIIEAMKVMNEIKAECSGTIVEVLVENGAAVEFGQPLFLIKP